MCKIEINDKRTIEEFLNYRIPKQYKALDCKANSFCPDLMYNYEEVFDYCCGLLNGKKIFLNTNFIEVESVAVNDDFKTFLFNLAQNDNSMKEFCEMFIKVITIIQKYAV